MKKLFSLLVVLMSQMAYGQSANSIFIDKFDGTNFQEVELAAPGSDRIVFWDHSALNPSYLTLGTGLSISGTTLNASATGGGTWGSITGTLADQTDLQSALGTKQALDSDLTAIAGLTTTSFGRSVLEVADAAGLRTLAGLVYDVGATADTLVMRDNNGAIYAESFAQIEATGGAAAVLRGTVLEFYNVAQDGYIGLLPPALVTSDALSVTLPGESGTLALLSDLAGYLTTADAASAYQPLDTQLTSLAGIGYTGNAGKFIRVNGGETGFELATVGGGGSTATLTVLGSDQTTTSTSYADVTGLTAALEADTRYQFEFFVAWRSSNSSEGIGLAIGGPASPATLMANIAINSSANYYLFVSPATAYDSGPLSNVGAGATSRAAHVRGVIVTGAAAGSLALRFRAKTGGANSATIKAGSALVVTPLSEP